MRFNHDNSLFGHGITILKKENTLAYVWGTNKNYYSPISIVLRI